MVHNVKDGRQHGQDALEPEKYNSFRFDFEIYAFAPSMTVPQRRIVARKINGVSQLIHTPTFR